MAVIMILLMWPFLVLKFSMRIALVWVALWTSLAWKTITLPFRVVSRILGTKPRQREVELEYMQRELVLELERVVRERNALLRCLEAAIKENKTMELVMARMEDQHDQSIANIQLLQRQQGKKLNPEPAQLEVEGATSRTRENAIIQTLFTAGLSVSVGIVSWEAEARHCCTPLIVALLAVVIVSLNAVVQFLSTLNKPASDAVALLSFNCFILGLLAYPALPTLATMGQKAVSFLGFSY